MSQHREPKPKQPTCLRVGTAQLSRKPNSIAVRHLDDATANTKAMKDAEKALMYAGHINYKSSIVVSVTLWVTLLVTPT